MNKHETLDIRTPPALELHSQGCRCYLCEEGLYSVPLERASSEDMARFILHKTSNETGLENHELRRLALSMVKKARDGAPELPGDECVVWKIEGHRGHHWYLSADYHFICACGLVYRESTHA